MTKVNQLLVNWPQGAVVTQGWLDAQGVDKTQAHKYQKSEWLLSVGHGAWQRNGDRVDWLGAVYGLQYASGLQSGAGLRIWPGGATALALAGFTHYLPLGEENISLFGAPNSSLPRWFRDHDWGARSQFYAPDLFAAMPDNGLQRFAPPRSSFELWISSPERAAIEMLYITPDELLFDAPVDVFNGLASLSPKRVQTLLEACRSVKVKRVFLVMARHSKHTWYQRLDLSRIDLGKGKRQLIPGGRLDKEFQITVPERFADGA